MLKCLLEIIFNEVGKENFDALNELFHEFYEKIDGMKMYLLKTSLIKKEDTPLTRVYYELCEKRDKILESMRRYKENNLAGAK